MRFQTATTDYTCTKKKSGLTGLPSAFDGAVLVCPAATGNTEAAISKMEIDLQPLQSANMDVFEVEVIAVLRNGDLETRRLRKIFRLTSSGIVDESSSGFQVIVASKDISDRTEGDSTQGGKTHDMVHGINTVMLIAIVLLGILSLGGLYYLYKYLTGGETPGDKLKKMRDKNLAPESETTPLKAEDGNVAQFKNLRY
jgi:hypothetical protein